MTKWVDYEKQIGHVTSYIYDHLDEPLDLNTLADVACVSPYHWHRVYYGLRGETAAATVKRLRLQRAASYLGRTALPVREVAKRSGYPNLQSFTRIFAAAYGMPPAQYRKMGSQIATAEETKRSRGAAHELAVKSMPLLNAISVAHRGDYVEIGRAFDELFTWLGVRNLIQPEMRLIGIYYDDPNAVDAADLRSRACVVVEELPELDATVEAVEIEAGSYAVLRHRGPYTSMREAYDWMFGEWLVREGTPLGDAPVFEEYLNDPRTSRPTELLTDIYLRLEEDGD